ncbi:DUF7344 domain-containing protein [Halorubellus salinus]|uniref:DUF7344 domain-containing protein n=1 Tax=Halorubellus salinus TaxID=755309 RepID=UPI001D084145|nr:hypothetical protein [Halorubellus salinus]
METASGGTEAEPAARLSSNDIHNVLRNERRALALEELRSGDEPVTLRSLSETIAEAETGESPAPRGARDSVYASLHQTHLPMLERHDVVEYERQGKEIRLAERARDLDPYLNVTTARGGSWQFRYMVIGVVGIATVGFAAANVPLLSVVSAPAWAVAFLAVFAVAILLQYGQQELGRRSKLRVVPDWLPSFDDPTSGRDDTENATPADD